MRLIERLAVLLFPPKCVLCGRLLQKDETDLCRRCRIETPEYTRRRFPIPFVAQWSALWYYDGNVRQSLLRYKFGGKRSYASVYGRLLAIKLQDVPFDLLTSVPVSARRRRKRGYDQVALLANAVGRELGRPPAALLRKTRDNPPQSGIQGRAQRKANVLGVYKAVSPDALAGKRILLLDDIITTGATVSECARVLLSAGAKEVVCAAVAAAGQQPMNQ